MKSAELNELFTALAKAQAEMPIAAKESTVGFRNYKYANLTEVISSTRPSLTKYNLSVLQIVRTNQDNGKNYLTTILAHSSGQFIEDSAELPSLSEFVELAKLAPDRTGKNKDLINGPMQSYGSSITYMRRYAYSAMIGVISEEDDDGEAASRPYRLQSTKAESNGYNEFYEKVSKDQLDMLDRALIGKEHLAESILKHYNYSTLADIPRDKFMSIYDRVVKIEIK